MRYYTYSELADMKAIDVVPADEVKRRRQKRKVEVPPAKKVTQEEEEAEEVAAAIEHKYEYYSESSDAEGQRQSRDPDHVPAQQAEDSPTQANAAEEPPLQAVPTSQGSQLESSRDAQPESNAISGVPQVELSAPPADLQFEPEPTTEDSRLEPDAGATDS